MVRRMKLPQIDALVCQATSTAMLRDEPKSLWGVARRIGLLNWVALKYVLEQAVPASVLYAAEEILCWRYNLEIAADSRGMQGWWLQELWICGPYGSGVGDHTKIFLGVTDVIRAWHRAGRRITRQFALELWSWGDRDRPGTDPSEACRLMKTCYWLCRQDEFLARLVRPDVRAALARLPRLQRHAVIARPDPLLSADDLNRQLLERALGELKHSSSDLEATACGPAKRT